MGTTKYFELRDLRITAVLAVLWPVAWFVPESLWPKICRLITLYKTLAPWEKLPKYATYLKTAFSAEVADQNLKAIEHDIDLHRHLLRLQILRIHSPWGWHPEIQVEGAEILRQALARNKGVILWMSHFIYNGLTGKIGLKENGFAVHHVSRPEHGFSKTRYGVHTINRIRVRAEEPYLAGRLVIDRNASVSIKEAIRNILHHNGIVSITSGAWEGRRFSECSFLNGKLRLATGAPDLAYSTGATLLPVFGFKDKEANRHQIVINQPIGLDVFSDKVEAIHFALAKYLSETETYVKEYPDQWRGWTKIKSGME